MLKEMLRKRIEDLKQQRSSGYRTPWEEDIILQKIKRLEQLYEDLFEGE